MIFVCGEGGFRTEERLRERRTTSLWGWEGRDRGVGRFGREGESRGGVQALVVVVGGLMCVWPGVFDCGGREAS